MWERISCFGWPGAAGAMSSVFLGRDLHLPALVVAMLKAAEKIPTNKNEHGNLSLQRRGMTAATKDEQNKHREHEV